MKRLFLLIMLITGLPAANVHAQMGHDMMREIDNEVQRGHMYEEQKLIDEDILKEKRKMSEPELIMGHHEMMNGMEDLTHDMAYMLKDISSAIKSISDIERKRSKYEIRDIANMMRQLCSEMSNMSDILESGMITDAEMTMMRSRVMEMEESVAGLDK